MKNNSVGLSENKLSKLDFLSLSFICILIFFSLGTFTFFGSPPQTSYFLYIILSSALLITFAIKFLTQPPIIGEISLSSLFFLGLFMYVILHGLLLNGYLNARSIYLCCSCMIFIGFSYACKDKNYQKQVLKLLLLFALGESVICIFQNMGLVNSYNDFITVSGTHINPNVIAMFLAMCWPAILYFLFRAKRIYKYILLLSLLTLLVGLLTLKCRSAFIGILVASLYLVNKEYNIGNRFKKNKQIFTKYTVVISVVICLFVLFIYAYRFKKESADGRKTIWAISSQMIRENPLVGYGYGMFEREYNLYQAAYFRTGSGTLNQKAIASYTHMAYNDFLESAIEGGIPGMLLWLFCLLSLLLSQHRKKKLQVINESILYYARAGIISFFIMSIINFTIQAIPVFFVFLLYSGIINTYSIHTKIFIANKGVPYKFGKQIGVIFFILAIYIFISQLQIVNATRSIENVKYNLKKNNFVEADHILDLIEKNLNYDPIYWDYRARIAYLKGDYSTAAVMFGVEKKYTSNPNVLIDNGYAFEANRNYKEAEREFSLASNMEPSRLLPKYALMKLFLEVGDTVNAKMQAESILQVRLKKDNEQATKYKNSAAEILSQLNNH